MVIVPPTMISSSMNMDQMAANPAALLPVVDTLLRAATATAVTT
jgi:hypothetical protein